MIFFEILYLALLIDKLALFILKFFLGDDPVIVDTLSLLLEIGQQFLLLLIGFFEVSELLSHWKLCIGDRTLNY